MLINVALSRSTNSPVPSISVVLSVNGRPLVSFACIPFRGRRVQQLDTMLAHQVRADWRGARECGL